MKYLNPHNAILELERLVSSKDSEIKLQANGGNSILLVCKPSEEINFINEIKQLEDSKYHIVDMNLLLVEFVENNKEDIEFYFEHLPSSLDRIFKNDLEGQQDFYHLILDKVNEAFSEHKIPVVINTGAIYATHFDMLSLMESKVIMNALLPAVFLYPAEYNQNNQLEFLNKRIASEYRCKII
ncbi:hypothetical protein HX091_12100 [Myroides odoratimimus]|uniref:hypothetical protein n=1 Tax=Myroides odoratimimus TaxID=76832 RepID=UPI002576C9DD|nr:hypothetical protein [Myroides odoratimimus]MDM1526680.1 hypothetical protein [Myroides odoratimimus]